MFIRPFPACFARQFTSPRCERLISALLLAPIFGLACASPNRQTLTAEETEQTLAHRTQGPEAALSPGHLAGLDALALPRPSPEELADPGSAGYWRACALAWNPAVRAARRQLQRAVAAEDGAGLPESIGLGAETMSAEDLDRESRLSATFDLLGILGVGPASVAREAARIDALHEHSRLERAVWRATFEVERARVRLGAARERISRMEALLRQVEAQSPRFEVLERRGRLSAAESGLAATAVHIVEHEISSERGREAELRAALAESSGLAFDHDAYAHVDGSALVQTRAVPESLGARQLLEQDPALRDLVLEFAQAEVRVRRVARDGWPTVRAGPRLTVMPSDILLGGMLDLSLPWPGRIEAELRVAETEREAAREQVEDALHGAVARVASLRAIEAQARTRAEEHAEKLNDAAEDAWVAMNARLRLGFASATEWTTMAHDRLAPLVGRVDAREAAVLAALDLAEACGVVLETAEVTP